MLETDDAVLGQFISIAREVIAEHGGDQAELADIGDLAAGEKSQMAESLRRFLARADKAEAFDRIADAYLHIPAGTPPADAVATAERNVIDVVSCEVQRLHPSYQTAEVPPGPPSPPRRNTRDFA